MKDEIILYRPDELAEHIEVRIDEKTETIWLTQQQIADLFGTQRPAITKHLGNIFKAGELDENVVSSILEHTTPFKNILYSFVVLFKLSFCLSVIFTTFHI